MAQELKQSSVNTFIGGLITEASPLTFPDNASVDELNCTLERKGVRRRRRGIENEDGFALSSFNFAVGTLVHSQTWKNVAGISSTEFLAVQVGGTLHFYDKSQEPISASEKSFSIDLNTFNAGNSEPVNDSRISGASINGNFVVTSAAIESFFIEYDSDTDTITTTTIAPKVRDFDWQGDTSGYFDNIDKNLVSDIRRYDTYNAGWIDEDDAGQDVLFGTDEGLVTRENIWPKLTHPWFVARIQPEKFFKGAFRKAYEGNTLIGNGHFILDLYNKDRATASSIPGLPVEQDTTRFSSVAGFGGRVWFAGLSSKKNGSRVFFSPTIENMTQVGNFYQVADPTAETVSDLIDSDGGVINIPAASTIVALFEWGGSLLVFAENGVWEVKGVDGVFKATEFSVSRISQADGITDNATLVDAEGTPFWWGKNGIYTIIPNTDPGGSATAQGSNISLSTIQTFWEAIDGDQRGEAVGEYDDINNRIFWLYGDDADIKYKYNKVLILDLALQAFIPWTFSTAQTLAEISVHSEDWTGSAPAAQVIDTDAGAGVWTLNRGTATKATGSIGVLTGLPIIDLTSIDTGGTVEENEQGRMGVYVDVVANGLSASISYLLRFTGTVGGTQDIARAQFKVYQADRGGVASAGDQAVSFMPPDAQNISLVFDSGVSTFPASPPPLDRTHAITGDYVSFQWLGGMPNLGRIEVGPVELFLSGLDVSYPVGMSYFNGRGSTSVVTDVLSNSGADDVVSSGGTDDVVAAIQQDTNTGATEMKFLVRDFTTGSMTFAGITNTDFLDWGLANYDSFAEAAYDFEDDMSLFKHGLYVTAYFDLTESGFEADEVTHLTPSSCIMSAFWDLKATANSTQEVYRLRLPVVVNSSDLTEFNYPYSSVVSRNRIRGRGRNLKLKFESTTGKDFRLQGYEVINAKNRQL